MSSVFMYALTLLTISTVLIVLIDKFVLEIRRIARSATQLN
jgi:hypothetical protein